MGLAIYRNNPDAQDERRKLRRMVSFAALVSMVVLMIFGTDWAHHPVKSGITAACMILLKISSWAEGRLDGRLDTVAADACAGFVRVSETELRAELASHDIDLVKIEKPQAPLN